MGNMRSWYHYYSDKKGELLGGCRNMCKRQCVSILHFAPMDESSQLAGFRTKFLEAHLAYKIAYDEGDKEECILQRKIVADHRTVNCEECSMGLGYLTPAQKKCKNWYDETRQAWCEYGNGCGNGDCPERGAHVWQILTGDHGTNPTKKHGRTGKPINLGQYSEWPAHGGVNGMELEAKQIEKWICQVCHRLEKTSASGKRYPDPESMPTGEHDGTDDEIKQYLARQKAVIKYPKQRYVDAKKREIGNCEACNRRVERDQEQGFDFNHLEESTKEKGGLFGKSGGVGGLVSNHTTVKCTLDHVKELLDIEMDKCNLLCANCHFRHTHNYPPSLTKFIE